jgi:uncharacterized protein (DUF1330 family)
VLPIDLHGARDRSHAERGGLPPSPGPLELNDGDDLRRDIAATVTPSIAIPASLSGGRPPALSCQPRIIRPKEEKMAAYFVAEVEVTNPVGYDPYRALAGASIAQYGGRFIVRGGTAELVEGSPAPQRVVIIEFADAAAARRWYNSPEYQAALPIRLANSRARALIVEGAL